MRKRYKAGEGTANIFRYKGNQEACNLEKTSWYMQIKKKPNYI